MISHISGLADRVPGASAPRSTSTGGGASRPGRRSRRPRRRQGPCDRVPGRGASCARTEASRPTPSRGQSPHADRAPGHRQDVDRESIARATDASSSACRWAASATRLRSAVTGVRHRCIARPSGQGAARCRHTEPRDPARRGRQGRRGLARRPFGGVAGGARPRTEPLLP